MPDVEVCHLTNRTTAILTGATPIRRYQNVEMARFRMEHHAQLTGEWLFIDTDVLITKDVQHVFESSFDIAVSNRDGMPQYSEDVWNLLMPHNMGVVFSRTQGFWQRCYDFVGHMTQEMQTWEGDQYAFCRLLKLSEYGVKILSGQQYNFAPVRATLDSRDHYIAHYKGGIRKDWLTERANEILEAA